MLESFDFVKNSDNKIPLSAAPTYGALTFTNSSETDTWKIAHLVITMRTTNFPFD